MSKQFGVAVKCLIKNENNKYLILKKTKQEAQNDHIQNLYDIPGGRVEYGEDIINALIREVFEETGINLSQHNIVKILNATSIIRKDDLHLVVITYMANVKNYNVNISSEHSDFYWVDEDFKGLPEWITNIINIAK